MRKLFNSQFRVTQAYGVNKDYYKQFGLQGHEGIDLVPTGTVWDVYCLADGVVVKDENNAKSGAYGNYVTVWHPTLNKATQYCHFSENYVNLGDKVVIGQRIGRMGSSGNTSGAHVHLNLFNTDTNGVRLNKDNGFLGGIDPLPFLNEEVTPENITQIEELRKQLEQEIKAKNETYQELVETRQARDGSFEEVKALKEGLAGLADLLKCAPVISDIRGEVAKLISNEDNNGTVGKLKEQVDLLTKELGEVKTDNITLRNENSQIQPLKDEIEKLKTAQTLEIIGKVFGIYLARKRGE